MIDNVTLLEALYSQQFLTDGRVDKMVGLYRMMIIVIIARTSIAKLHINYYL